MSSDIKVRRTGTAGQAAPAYPGGPAPVQTPRTTGANVTRWQAHVQRRGFSIGADPVGGFDVGSRQAARDAQSSYGLVAWDAHGMNVDGSHRAPVVGGDDVVPGDADADDGGRVRRPRR